MTKIAELVAGLLRAMGALFGCGRDTASEPAGRDAEGNLEVAWGAKVPAAFRAKVIEVARRLRMDPSILMAVMAFETGRQFKASTPAGASSAVGLIQFMPATAKALGTTSSALAKMSEIEQMDYVEKYLAPFAGRLNDLPSAYMAVLWPRAVSKPLSHVLWARGEPQYGPNKGLDVNADGKVTKAEAAFRVEQQLVAGMKRENLG